MSSVFPVSSEVQKQEQTILVPVGYPASDQKELSKSRKFFSAARLILLTSARRSCKSSLLPAPGFHRICNTSPYSSVCACCVSSFRITYFSTVSPEIPFRYWHPANAAARLHTHGLPIHRKPSSRCCPFPVRKIVRFASHRKTWLAV